MFSTFFGNYLLNKGLVSKENLSKVLQVQKEVRLKLGVLAINAGYMNASQVQEVNDLQVRQDRRFGDLAVDRKYITSEQLNDLLKQQKSEHLLLAQALIDENLMTLSEFEKELTSYKIAHSMTDEEFDALKDGNVEIVLNAFLDFNGTENASIYRDYIALLFKNIIRFIDTDVRIEKAEAIESAQYPHIFTQAVSGEIQLSTAFAGSDEVFIAFASKFAEESFTEMDDYAKDAMGEFLNIHNGLFTVNMSISGVELDLTVQTYEKDQKIHKANLFKIPFFLNYGSFDVLIGTV